MAGVEEGGADAGRHVDGLVVMGRTAEIFEHVHGVEHAVERRIVALVAAVTAGMPALVALGVLLLQAGRIEHHHPGQLARGRRWR